MSKLLLAICLWVSLPVLGQSNYAYKAAPIKVDSNTIEVVVEAGEQLGTLSQRYLVQPATEHWREVAQLNKLTPPYTIYPGDKLRLPTRLLAAQAAPAKWIAVYGDVRVNQNNLESMPAVVGGVLKENEKVIVGEAASAVLQLADGSQIKLLAGAQLVMDEHQYYLGRKEGPLVGTRAFSGLLRLIQGSVEAMAITATDRAKPLRIQTPTSVVGVRGTQFRVSHSSLQEVDESLTRSEVLEGLVAVELDINRKANVNGGFGVVLDPKVKGPLQSVALLQAPDLSQWKLNQGRPVIQFDSLPTQLGGKPVAAYRVQVAPIQERTLDDPFQTIAFDKRFKVGEPVRIPNLMDGVWRVRARGIDSGGLEGINGQMTINLKARPEPPLIQSPKPAEKIVQTRDINLLWSGVSGASGYVLEIISASGVRSEYVVMQANASLKNLAPGRYTWRIATQTKKDIVDKGPWSDPQEFTVVATPQAAQAEMDIKHRTLSLRWSDQKAAKYDVQFAKDSTFNVQSPQFMQLQTVQPSVMLNNPASGVHYARYRAIEADGFVGGWSGVMTITVPTNWQHLLLYLGGGTTQWP